MKASLRRLVQPSVSSSPWADGAPIREELFGIERLEQHAESLAAAQSVSARAPSVPRLRSRLDGNAAVLLAAYRASAAEVESGRGVVPAAEWLLDNYHVVEAQIRQIRDDLPPGYYRQLPKLADGPFAGYPRVFGLAWAFVAHTDSQIDPDMLRRFIAAYQRVQPLTIGELWAIAITLRIVLVENLRRLADQMTAGRIERADADALASRLLAAGQAHAALQTDIAARGEGPISEVFAAQLGKQLRDQDPRTTPALAWLNERLHRQGGSLEEAVQHAQMRLGASNVSVRNVITSMRLISDIDWTVLFESVSLVDAHLREGSEFAAMDFPSRTLYRSAIEQLARGAPASELEIADRALAAAEAAPPAARTADPGYHLIAAGRPAFERAIGFRAPAPLRFSRFCIRLGIGGYTGAILLTAAALLALALWLLAASGVGAVMLALGLVLGLVPATELATTLVNRAVARNLGATPLPGLELASGVPSEWRTLVAVPTLLTTDADLLEQVERLEIHHLASGGGDFTFALLSDGRDATQAVLDSDSLLLTRVAAAVALLNQRYGPGPAGPRFLLLHRARVYNAGERAWMGWERKRGKLHELNRLLRGAEDTHFVAIDGCAPWVPEGVRYVITLDVDTILPRGAALRLVGKMAHPLNRPSFSHLGQRVVDGYGILQPRVTPLLPNGDDGSLYQRVVAGPGGMDPYAAAVSDVYQDLFGEGSYTGKGIYDVDVFERALAGRIPDNAMLSHDLFEGVFARAGLASDVEVVEAFPGRYDVVTRRQHRWVRGDWQLLPWVFGRRLAGRGLPAIGLAKVLDNLRRSLLPPMTLAALVWCWLLPLPSSMVGTLLLLASLAVPAFLPALSAVLPRRPGLHFRPHAAALLSDLRLAGLQTLFTLAFLADQAWWMGDAIGRTLTRLLVTQRHLLEWTTAAHTAGRPQLGPSALYRRMAGGTALGLALATVSTLAMPSSWPATLPLGLLWLAAPLLAFRASRAGSVTQGTRPLSESDARSLRLTARRTWRFFETFVTAADQMLPPDNFQEDPKPVVARRTSPTNMGLYLLSAVAAHDFGWTGKIRTVERLEETLATMRKLQKFRGHFFNWYDTADLRTLDPAYVSSVDSGNLAGHLLALANACEEWIEAPLLQDMRAGMIDALHLARAAADALADARGARIVTVLDEIAGTLADAEPSPMLPVLKRLVEDAARMAHDITNPRNAAALADLAFWIGALQTAIAEHEIDRRAIAEDADRLRARLQNLAETARGMALAMDFAFLLDPSRQLLSIGYSLADGRLDPNCYDLLASEARLASLFAIAKGDVPARHWFRLGRSATAIGSASVLVSWSGSMFEYLMPSLVMRAPAGSLLAQTARQVVARQQSYARLMGIPWGISESAYNARDVELTYQYSNFGVPGLGLKRGLAENRVVAPYATGLAAMVDPQAARRNLTRLAGLNALGRYGFYEALDFTKARLPKGEPMAIVRSFMAHHQGMTIVAIANALQDGRMRGRFHREPMIRASELLLQERMPRDVEVAHLRVEELKAAVVAGAAGETAVRRLAVPTAGASITHLLSNGRYAVMLTAEGAGYSRWGDIAVTRWREDSTRDDWGAFVFLRDMRSGAVWSATGQPVGGQAGNASASFTEDHAEFIRRDGPLTTKMDVLVSGEDDGEVRRVSLINSGRRPYEIELTSYAELVLTTPAADNAHPAFSKMFVQTDYLAEFGALIATRRLRAPQELPVWAAHFAVVEGEILAAPQYESDRTRFLGRNRGIGAPAAMAESAVLSGTIGTVLDPIFALRHRVAVPPGKVVHVAFWTLIAPTKAALLDLVDRHHDRRAYDRAKTLAWTQAQVQLRHLGVTAAEAEDFQRLAAPILYADPRFRPPAETIGRGAGAQSGLWPLGISGDLPIVLLRIDDADDIAQVQQLLRAHEYWRMKRLAIDIVIVNERASSYVQDLQGAIETAMRSRPSPPGSGPELTKGAVYAVRADLMPGAARSLLHAVARVVLVARQGPIANQLARARVIPPAPAAAPISPLPARRASAWPSPAAPADLEFFNGLGGFDQDGREYVTILEGGNTTPAPWINVIANPVFGFQVSAEGSGYSWAENSREHQLTAWSNDPVRDPIGEAIYIRDEITGDLWTPTAQPIRSGGRFTARHGHGYSSFEHEAQGIAVRLLHYVPLADPVKISRLTLRNDSGRKRRLSITAYAEWVLGTSRSASAPFLVTAIDEATGAMLARNPWSTSFPGRVAFADLAGQQTAWTADRTEFLGRNGSPEAPAALTRGSSLSGTVGAGHDPCAALQTVIEIAAGESVEIVSLLGACGSVEAVQALVTRYRACDLDAVLAEVTAHWQSLLGAVQVRTPDRAMDIMLNGWLLYQTLACRIWARSAFYQASGAYGFRDQLQDGMALAFSRPAETRSHLLQAAGRQFVEGDVQHWWLPQSGQGVRTRISDDRVWLAYAAATYVLSSGDAAVLDECLPFIEGPALQPGEHDAFFQPIAAEASASLFEHCARALDQCLDLTGVHGLPLIGTGDWNDGMNRVGEAGQGESVWLGWLLVRTIALFAPLAEAYDMPRALRWRRHAAAVRGAIERTAWDGAWYRRATFDDGRWLGTADGEACQIDSIAQSWSVLSAAADPARAATAMASMEARLIRRDEGLALLFWPPFDDPAQDPGYIKGYPPGLRENGGQYSHAAMWAIFAQAQLGQGSKAADLFALINPINHARTGEAVARYKVEPYVVAADVYSVPPHAGRGGWTWYTGSAGWMYRAGVEGILGLCRDGAFLLIAPCIPDDWPGFEATLTIAETRCTIRVQRAPGTGSSLPCRVPLDGETRTITIMLPAPRQDDALGQRQDG